MKKLLIVSFAAAALCSCGGANYTITGRYELTPGDSIDLLDLENNILASGVMNADTTVSLKGKVTTPGIVGLTSRNRAARPAYFILEPGNIRIGAYDNALGYYPVTGTPLNDKKTAFEDAMKVFGEKVQKGGQSFDEILAECSTLYTRTVDANLDNIFGVYIFNTYEFQELENDPEKVKARLAQFSPEMQAHPMLKQSQERIDAIERSTVGKPYTDLALKNADGETVALSSLVGPGRWVLLDFWATWCQPCMMEIPHLKKAYETYKEKGFEIYGVSLDKDPAAWKKGLEEQGMNWTNTMIRKNDGLDATALYDISRIPSNFLISPEGKIVAKNLRGEQLEEKLAEALR